MKGEKMEHITKIELKFSIERSKKPQMMKKIISSLEKIISQPQFRDLDLVSIKEVR